jgi:hypothetical protein
LLSSAGFADIITKKRPNRTGSLKNFNVFMGMDD